MGKFLAPLDAIEPVTFLTVGTREAPSGHPPTMSVWNVFFDKPAKRPFQTHVSSLEVKQVRVTSEGRRATVAMGDLTIGPFSGELQFTFYASSRLVHVEAVVSTPEDQHAILYDAGLTGESPGWQRIAWMDTEGRWQRVALEPSAPDQHIAVRQRALFANVARFRCPFSTAAPVSFPAIGPTT
jgi:hypothetical protein